MSRVPYLNSLFCVAAALRGTTTRDLYSRFGLELEDWGGGPVYWEEWFCLDREEEQALLGLPVTFSSSWSTYSLRGGWSHLFVFYNLFISMSKDWRCSVNPDSVSVNVFIFYVKIKKCCSETRTIHLLFISVHPNPQLCLYPVWPHCSYRWEVVVGVLLIFVLA